MPQRQQKMPGEQQSGQYGPEEGKGFCSWKFLPFSFFHVFQAPLRCLPFFGRRMPQVKERDESSNGGSSLFFGKSSGNNIRGGNPTFLNVIRKVRLPFFLCVTGFLFLFSVCQGVVLPALACTEEGGILSSHFPGMEKTGGVGKEKTAESALSCGIPSHISDSLLFSRHARILNTGRFRAFSENGGDGGGRAFSSASSFCFSHRDHAVSFFCAWSSFPGTTLRERLLTRERILSRTLPVRAGPEKTDGLSPA